MPPPSDVPSTAPRRRQVPLQAGKSAEEPAEETSANGAPSPPSPPPPPEASAPSVAPTGPTRRQRRRRRRLSRIAFAVAVVVLVASIPVLGYVGYRAVYTSTAGRKINLPTDPSKEGFEATVSPSPTSLFLVSDGAGGLAGAAVASLAVDAGGTATGGSLLLLPVNALSPQPPAPDAQTLAKAWVAGGKDSVERAVTRLFGLAFDEVVVIDHARWADLVGPVAPLTLDNPDRITEAGANGRTRTVFAAGELELAASDVGAYFEARSPGESELSRLARQQRLWDAWLSQVRSAPDPLAAVPGEVATGIGRYVRVLAAGTHSLFQLPVLPPVADDAGTEKEAFTADADAASRLVATIVPYPTGGPDGGRVRVRILDGVRQPGVSQLVAPLLVPEGAEIVISGNADRFTYDKTQIVYYDDGYKEAADRFRRALGAGELVLSSVPNDSNDVTVVIGRDFVDNGAATTVTTGGSGG